MDILHNFDGTNLKPYMWLDNVCLEGNVSQFFYLGPSFYFMMKTGNFWLIFETYFSRFHKMKTRT